MTKPIVGNVVANIFNDGAAVCYANDKLLAAALDDLLDGDDDTTTAALLLNELRTRNTDLFRVNELGAKGMVKEAEIAVMQLAASKQGKTTR